MAVILLILIAHHLSTQQCTSHAEWTIIIYSNSLKSSSLDVFFFTCHQLNLHMKSLCLRLFIIYTLQKYNAKTCAHSKNKSISFGDSMNHRIYKREEERRKKTLQKLKWKMYYDNCVGSSILITFLSAFKEL